MADTFAGRVHVEWNNSEPVTRFGQLPFFVEFVKQGGLFDAMVADCPLHCTSPNTPKKRDVLGTVLLSVQAAHWRYAHMRTVGCDKVNPPLLGMTEVVCEARCGVGSMRSRNATSQCCERRNTAARNFLFKLRLTKNLKQAIEPATREQDWQDAGHRWQGKENQLRLQAWGRQRRVAVLRRRRERSVSLAQRDEAVQLQLSFADLNDAKELWKHAVLVTSLDSDILTIGQLCRDRADCENYCRRIEESVGLGSSVQCTRI